ncbi:class I SAM-dependent methyltransferase [Methanobacterium sp. CWC-01]|uniref:class I SAM-dependent methyltransferase n=1 Tax=Methanobacterium aridiramus TaxID=2584467 RepID=UPI00257590C7|nr:class I SAM-dependent methyltransferase [Methanobacterium sp. CWC-01]WJI09281.1 class I SAM-dependent methyltransferase [Methanobacterium sp. CWC-01]
MYGYFEIQAKVGITKHMGGLEATKKLLELCQVDKSDQVLVVGSGNGVSAIKIHEFTGCQVTGIDLSQDMVERAREKHAPGIEFQVGDAENLNFAADSFDVVLSESVTGFTNKTRSIPEYYRVLKSGGYLGLNEVTWMYNPSSEIKDYYRRVMGINPDSRESWLSLLEEAGFKDINSLVRAINYRQQVVGDLELQSMDFFRIWGRFFRLYFKDPEYRRSVHRLSREALHMPRGFDRYFGYGLYVGRK